MNLHWLVNIGITVFTAGFAAYFSIRKFQFFYKESLIKVQLHLKDLCAEYEKNSKEYKEGINKIATIDTFFMRDIYIINSYQRNLFNYSECPLGRKKFNQTVRNFLKFNDEGIFEGLDKSFILTCLLMLVFTVVFYLYTFPSPPKTELDAILIRFMPLFFWASQIFLTWTFSVNLWHACKLKKLKGRCFSEPESRKLD